jgi:hypothetical protein
MKKSYLLFLFPIVAIIFFCIYFFSTFHWADEYSEVIYNKWYLINSSTILASIKNGDNHVFTISPSYPTISPQNVISPKNWKFEDYLLVAKAFYENVLGESIDDWKLHEIDTFHDCEEYDNEEVPVNFYFFKIKQDENGLFRSVHVIYINTDENYIEDSEDKHTNLIEDWKSIDYKNIKVPLRTAILTAEAVGGKDYRIKNNNNCQIEIYFKAEEGDNNSWHLFYSSTHSSGKEFEIYINANDGHYKIVQ